jgi:hypothetical protein
MVDFLWLTGRSIARRAVGDGVVCRRVRVGLALLLCVRVCVSPRVGGSPPLCGGPLVVGVCVWLCWSLAAGAGLEAPRVGCGVGLLWRWSLAVGAGRLERFDPSYPSGGYS